MAEKLHSGGGCAEPDLRGPRGTAASAAPASPADPPEMRGEHGRRSGDFLCFPGAGAGPDWCHIPTGTLPEQKRHQAVDVQHPGRMQGPHGGVPLQVRDKL